MLSPVPPGWEFGLNAKGPVRALPYGPSGAKSDDADLAMQLADFILTALSAFCWSC